MPDVSAKEVIAMFRECDADGDGKLDKKEFKNIMNKLQAGAADEMSEQDMQMLIDAIDTNQDGAIQVEELVAFIFQEGDDIIAHVTAMFKLYDLDGSMYITMEENIKVDKMIAEAMGQPFDEEKSKENFKKSDENSDQKVSLEEFIKFVEITFIEPCRKDGLGDDQLKEKLAPMMWQAKILAGLAHMFTLYDLDGSGSITLDENIMVDKMLAESCGQTFDEEKCKAEFKKADADTDTKVALEEFVSYCTKAMIEPARAEGKSNEQIHDMIMPKIQDLKILQLLTRMFKTFDLDGSGFISFEENVKVYKALCEVIGDTFDEEKCKENFKGADTNNDDKVSQDEFVSYATKMFITPARESGQDPQMLVMGMTPLLGALKAKLAEAKAS